MRIIATKNLLEFARRYGAAKVPLFDWFYHTRNAQWSGPADVKRDFPNVSIIANNRLVFNIGGNKFRLIVGADYKRGILYLKFFGSHSKYNKVDAATVELGDD